ncbi:MAG: hypothetical protein ACQESK_04505 [Bacteroidota bacterium]
MKKIVVLSFIISLIFSCSDDDIRRDNPNLLDINFTVDLNRNLPQFNALNFPGNAIYYGASGVGNAGIIVANTGGQIVAWDAADPNLVPQTCSTLEIQGLEAYSFCESQHLYSLVTGQPLQDGLRYPLYAYRVSENGSTIRVYN